MRRSGPVAALFIGVALALAFTAAPASTQTTSSSYQPKRTSWGAPAIDGVWDFRTLTPLERPREFRDQAFFAPEEARAFRERTLRQLDVDQRTGNARVDVEGAYNTFWWDWGTEVNEDRRTSLIVDPPDGRLPAVTAEARAWMQEQKRLRTPPLRDLFSLSAAEFPPEGPESVGLSERCLVGFNAGPPLTPSAYNNNLRIVQTRDYVVLETEMIHDARIVPLDGRPHLPAAMERWLGDSRGHWEGDTLVVETTGFTDKKPTFQLPITLETALQGAGAVGTARTMRLIERFRPVAEGRLLYEYTLADPAFARPFTVAIPMRASRERMYEYACHEGNYAMRGMLKGARVLEAETEGSRAPSGSGN